MTNPINVMFDINGVLLDWHDNPTEFVEVLKILSKMRNVRVGVWSHRGKEYAEYVVENLELEPYVWQVCGKDDPDAPPADIAFDDQLDFAKAKFNLITEAKPWRRPKST